MLSDEEKRLIYEQVASSQAAAEANQKTARAMEIRNGILVQISEDVARLLEPLRAFVTNYQSLANAIATTDEKLEDLHARQAVIDRATKLILELERAQLGNIRDGKQRRELEEKIDEAQGLSLDGAAVRRRLSKQINNLQYLEEQAATYGGRVPLETVNQITDLQEIIQELQLELKRVED